MRSRGYILVLSLILHLGCSLSMLSQSDSTSANNAIPDTIAGGTIDTVAGNGNYVFCGDGSKATVACLYRPTAATFDLEGNYYIVDQAHCVVRKVTPGNVTGSIETVAGTPNSCAYSGDGGPATAAQLNQPTDVKVDSALNLYISDTNNNRIRKVEHATGIISTYAGTGVPGYNGDLGSATKALVNHPKGLALNSESLYIADTNNNVIRIVSAATGDINTFAGTGVQGYINGSSTEAEFNAPAGLALFGGNLFIADSGNGAVREVNGQQDVSTVAGTGTQGTFNGWNACASGKATAANLTDVVAVAFDASGNLYLSNYFNYGAPYGYSYICKVNTAGAISTIAGLRSLGFSGDGGQATLAAINEPAGLGFDSYGDLFLADTNNFRIREIYSIGVPVAAATPSISPAGGTYLKSVSVTITDTTKGATIYYTTNGSSPTTSSTKYTEAIDVTQSETIKALAVVSGYSNSAIASAAFLIDSGVTAMPGFSLAAGAYGTEQIVSLTDATAGAVIYYTSNGTTPTTSSTKYEAAIPISASETIKAIAVAPNYEESAVASQTYAIATTPAALTAPAVSITTSTATVNALVNPGGVAATYSFQYGTSSSVLTGTTPQMTLAAISSPVNVNAALTGLKASTKYYFRIIVTTLGGSSTSTIEGFTTQ